VILEKLCGLAEIATQVGDAEDVPGFLFDLTGFAFKDKDRKLLFPQPNMSKV
jgi:hypothetical protein